MPWYLDVIIIIIIIIIIIHPFINNGRTRRPLTPIKYIENT